MPVRPLDTLLAVKAINLAPGLLENDRRVATVLIEHFNRKTGRCDPGLERLAALIGCSTRTVIRAISRLEKADIVRKDRHGGYSNRNSYEPNWSWFSQQEAIWRQKMRARTVSRDRKMSPGERLSCHAPPDSSVTQTCLTNQLKQTYSKESAEGIRSSGPALRCQSSHDAALVEAERRWSNDLLQAHRVHPVTYGEIIGLIDEELAAAATKAEFARRGGGLHLISRQLKLVTRGRFTGTAEQ